LKANLFTGMLNACLISEALKKANTVDLTSEAAYWGAVEFAEALRATYGHARHEPSPNATKCGQDAAQWIAWDKAMQDMPWESI
jgi:hypothetical protein